MKSMKNIKIVFALLASLILVACSSDSNDSGSSNGIAYYVESVQSEAPVWQVDWNYNHERPDWKEPTVTYENWTILMVQIEEELQPYVTKDDMMAAFVNDELRGLAPSPATNLSGKQTDKAKFIIKAGGNETGSETVNISLRYYCHKLKQIFTLSENMKLDADVSTGIDENYIPEFTKGSAKYPVVKTVTAESILRSVLLKSASGNTVAAFVGDECRGKVKLSETGSTPLVIFGRSAGESVSLKYFDSINGIIYVIPGIVKM